MQRKDNPVQVKNHKDNVSPSFFKYEGKNIPIVESRYSFKRCFSENVPENHEDIQLTA